MPVTDTTERRFEDDITGWLLFEGGYTRNADVYDPQLGLFPSTLIRFVQRTQPKEWARFVNMNAVNPERKFCTVFNNACDMDGLLYVLRHGFKHRGITFRVCYFKPESELNQTDAEHYSGNELSSAPCGCFWRGSCLKSSHPSFRTAVHRPPTG